MKCGFQSEAWHCVHLTCEAHDKLFVSQSVQINILPVFKPQTLRFDNHPKASFTVIPVNYPKTTRTTLPVNKKALFTQAL